MIKAVIFDIGGVLIRTEDPAPRAALEVRLGLAPGQAEYLVLNSAMGRKAQLGQHSAGEQWAWVQQQLALSSAELAAFRSEFWAGDRVDDALVAFIRSLRRHYQTAIISNAMDDLDATVQRLDPGGDTFGVVVGSAYEGVMKPTAAIYERTLARLGRLPAEAIFVDDNAANIAGAAAVGLTTIHFQPGMDVPAVFARLGITWT